MAVDIGVLTDALQKAFTEKNTVYEYDAVTGKKRKKQSIIVPPKDKMKKLATEVLNHITNNAEVYRISTNVSTAVTTTVAPGILVTTPVGPGATSAPGAGTGSGTGTGSQVGTGKVK